MERDKKEPPLFLSGDSADQTPAPEQLEDWRKQTAKEQEGTAYRRSRVSVPVGAASLKPRDSNLE